MSVLTPLFVPVIKIAAHVERISPTSPFTLRVEGIGSHREQNMDVSTWCAKGLVASRYGTSSCAVLVDP
eukprot:746156-Hanusia_phi.AAC.3